MGPLKLLQILVYRLQSLLFSQLCHPILIVSVQVWSQCSLTNLQVILQSTSAPQIAASPAVLFHTQTFHVPSEALSLVLVAFPE